jgi:hypothetical protein
VFMQKRYFCEGSERGGYSLADTTSG